MPRIYIINYRFESVAEIGTDTQAINKFIATMREKIHVYVTEVSIYIQKKQCYLERSNHLLVYCTERTMVMFYFHRLAF